MADGFSLYIPEPPTRPGDAPDFSHLRIPAAGAEPRPAPHTPAEKLRDMAYGLVRVLDGEGRAVGPWAPALTPDQLRDGLRAMTLTRLFEDRMFKSHRQGKTSFFMKSTGEEAIGAALVQMGIEATAILRAADGAPLWPAGVLGSITHTDGYACAVVGPSSRFAAMGVDAERIGGVGDDLLPRLFDDEEQARLMAMDVDKRRVAATLGFSAKEACFKAFGARFRDNHIKWGDGVFRTERGEGRFMVQDGLALTAIFLTN